LKNKWHGPFRIIRRTGLKYELDIQGNPEFSSSRIIPKVHHDRLKPAYSLFELPPAEDSMQREIDDIFDHTFLPEDSFEEELLEDEYEVESIQGHRMRVGEVDGGGVPIIEYRIRWKGYNAKDDTWLGRTELQSCLEVLKTYESGDMYKHYEELRQGSL
jgi:hypothetical protein